MKKELVRVEHSRFSDQRKVMEQIVEDGVCPFCPENLRRYHREPVLKETEFWFLTKAQWPRENSRYTFLAILKKHTEKLADLPSGAGEELFELLREIEKEYAIPGGGFLMRFGQMDYSGASVLHLHLQLAVPLDPAAPNYEPVRFKIGKSK